MVDIVERLRLIDPTLELRYVEDVTKKHEIGLWCHEAADEIERLKQLYMEAEVKAAAHLNEIERLRAAADDLAQYVSRADWHYLEQETRDALGEKE